jgi:hypothetical protein
MIRLKENWNLLLLLLICHTAYIWPDLPWTTYQAHSWRTANYAALYHAFVITKTDKK